MHIEEAHWECMPVKDTHWGHNLRMPVKDTHWECTLRMYIENRMHIEIGRYANCVYKLAYKFDIQGYPQRVKL